MWDTLQYAVNMFYYQWLIKKLLWPIAGQNTARQESQTKCREKEGKVKEMPSAPEKQDVTNHNPCG